MIRYILLRYFSHKIALKFQSLAHDSRDSLLRGTSRISNLTTTRESVISKSSVDSIYTAYLIAAINNHRIYSYLWRSGSDKSVLSRIFRSRSSKYLISETLSLFRRYRVHCIFACSVRPRTCLHAPPFFIQCDSRLHELQPLHFRSVQLIIREIYSSDVKYDEPNLAFSLRRVGFNFNAIYVENKSRLSVYASRASLRHYRICEFKCRRRARWALIGLVITNYCKFVTA